MVNCSNKIIKIKYLKALKSIKSAIVIFYVKLLIYLVCSRVISGIMYSEPVIIVK